MKEKSVVLVEFTGTEAGSGRVFDTTSEQTAKGAGFYREDGVYGPLPAIVGHGGLLPGLESALMLMSEGESKKLRLSAKEAFGERRKELVFIVPLQEFRKRGIQPVPGLVVDLNGSYGRVQTVSGGRVRVDMNNDLAGKEVDYELKVVREVKDPKEKAQLLAEKYFPLKRKAETRIEGDALKVKLPKEIAQKLGPLAAPFTKTVKEVMPEIRSVEIVESFEAEKDKADTGKNRSSKN